MSENIRMERRRGWTTLPNDLLRNRDLSLKAKGAMAIMCSLPDGWSYSVKGLASVCNVGRDSMGSILKELERAGYLTRRQVHSSSGTFAGYEYIVRDVKSQPLPGNPLTVKPATDKPSPEKPLPENPAQYKKDLIQETSNIPPCSPPMGDRPTPDAPSPDASQAKRTRRARSVPVYSPERFEQLWAVYPGGGSRAKAVAAWDKLKPDDDLIDRMARALKRQMRSEQWQRGIGIPHLSTWLNGSGWLDKIPERSGGGQGPPSTGGWAPDPEVLE